MNQLAYFVLVVPQRSVCAFLTWVTLSGAKSRVERLLRLPNTALP